MITDFKTRREALGLTRKEAAEKWRENIYTIGNWECGKCRIPGAAWVLMEIAEAKRDKPHCLRSLHEVDLVP